MTTTVPMKVLIVGATGEVGRAIVPVLGESFDLRLLCRGRLDDARAVRADIQRLDAALLRAFQGVQAVVHLAVAGGRVGTFEDDAFNDRRFDVNVKGTWHVFEAARRAGVRRVVHTSSLMTLWGYQHPAYGPPPASLQGSQGTAAAMTPGDAEARPVGTYALTKALAEQVARYYAEAFGMEVVTLRIAAPLDPGDARWRSRPVPPQRIPFAELARAYGLALRAPLSQYEVVTLVGESSRRRWSLDAAGRVLGYVPQMRLDDLGLTLGEPFDAVASDPNA